MKTNEKVFRHSSGKLALMFLGVLFLGYIAISIGKTDYFLMAMAVIAFIVTLFYATSRITISNEEISTNRLLSSKTIRWSEIVRVSTRGQGIRLHNRDEDVILGIDSQLDGYSEILDIIFSKRPDLFDDTDTTLSSTWLLSLFIFGFGLFLIVISILLFFVSEGSDKIYSLIFLAIGLFVIGNWFLSPKRLTLENKTLMLNYFFKEISYSADDIDSISLEKRRTKNGYVYFAQINLKSAKKIKLPTFKQGTALTYQILKRWHAKAISNIDNSLVSQTPWIEQFRPR